MVINVEGHAALVADNERDGRRFKEEKTFKTLLPMKTVCRSISNISLSTFQSLHYFNISHFNQKLTARSTRLIYFQEVAVILVV